METYKDVKLRSTIAPNFVVLQILGYWQPEKGSQTIKNIYKVYGFIVIGFFFAAAVISEIINIYLSFGNLEELTAASFLFLTHLAQVFKLYYFSTKNKRIKDLANSLERDIFKPKSLIQFNMLKKSMFQGMISFYVFINMSLSTCLLWGLFPVLEADENGNMELPLKAFYPFDTDGNELNFKLAFAYQIISTSINAATNVSMDTVASSLMCLVCGQLDMLNDKILNIREYATENLLRRNDLVIQIKERDELFDCKLQDEMDALLVHCVDHHRNILELTNEIGDLFNMNVLGQFAAGSIIICLTMFELTLVELFSLQFISMVLYQGCMLVEIALYCWFGNEIILKSSQLSLSAYSSDWTHCSNKYKKKLLFLMVRAKVPIKLYAGNFFTLSLDTFGMILRSSWSYFAVLNRVHSSAQNE